MVSGVPTDKENFNVCLQCLFCEQAWVQNVAQSCWHSVVASYCLVLHTLNVFGALWPSVLILSPSPNTVVGNQAKDEAFARLRCCRFGVTHRSHLLGSSLIHGDGRELCTRGPRWENNVKMFKNLFCSVVTLCNSIGPDRTFAGVIRLYLQDVRDRNVRFLRNVCVLLPNCTESSPKRQEF